MSAPTHDLGGSGVLVPLPVRFTIGLDLGKLSDYSALAVVEERPERVIERFNQATVTPIWGEDPDRTIPHLQRWPLQTSYATIAAEVGRLVATLAGRAQTEVRLFTDATGVGVAVTEMLLSQEPIRQLAHRSGFAAVTITGGTATSKGYASTGQVGYTTWHVPKVELVGAAQMALQSRKVKVAETLPEAATLVAELRNFQVAYTESANATYNARVGAHDDLVLAAATALWGSRQRPSVGYNLNYRTGGDIAPYGAGVRPYGARRH